MTINEYQQAALRTEAPKRFHMAPGCVEMALLAVEKANGFDEQVSLLRLLEGIMGLNGESGEASDILKKFLFQGHELDREHVAKELGDVAWYLALAADAIGYDLETILQKNIDKLTDRYPNGFESDKSVNRKEGDI